MRFTLPTLVLPILADASHALNPEQDHRRIQSASCLAAINFTATFTSESCTPASIDTTIANAIAISDSCMGATVSSELSSLLGVAEGDTDAIASAIQTKCNTAFEDATLEFSKITKRGDAFDREFFAGGSDWNDQYQVEIDGKVHYVLSEDASRIMHEIQADTAASMPIEFPSRLPAFENCAVGAVMCCHVSDRQANDAAGLCADGDVCADADPLDNTDVCAASMADAPVSNRVQRGLAVYDLNDRLEDAEGNVNCHGFAWDSEEGGSVGARYKGNMLFDVAFKQSLYEKGYVKNLPGAPMCGCIEQMPSVTRADCTKIASVSETYTLSATSTEGTLELEMTDVDLQYGPCDDGEDLSSHYKQVNAPNTPAAIDAKLVGKDNCDQFIDASMASYGYQRSALEIVNAYFSPPDVSPARLTIAFNTAVSDAASAMGSFKVYDSADPTAELAIASVVLKNSNSAVEITFDDMPSSTSAYEVSNLVTLHKMIAPMVTLVPHTSSSISTSTWDYLQIGNWRIGKTCESCSNSHFSVASDTMLTSQIFRETGTTHPGPRSDYNGYDIIDSYTGPTYSVNGIIFGDNAVQVKGWRIKQMDDTHLSVSHESGNVARIYRSDGTVHGNVKSFSGYKEELGEPACTYLTDTYLQVGDWRFGAYDATHLSVSHRGGKTAMIYRSDGTIHSRKGRTDYNMWTIPDGEVLMGSNEACTPLSPSEPNVLQVGSYWKLAQMYDSSHFSFSSKQYDGLTGNAAKTAVIYRNDGRAFNGPRSDYNAWGDVPTYSDSPPRFGDKTLEIDEWRIRQIDGQHLSISHTSGNVARLYRSDGRVLTKQPMSFSGWANQELGAPNCAFRTADFVQLGDWRLGEFDTEHFSVSHASGNTAMIYKTDGRLYAGPRTDYGTWDSDNFPIGTVLEGSADGCATILDAMLTPHDPARVDVKFNRALLESSAAGLVGSFKVYDGADSKSELAISSAVLNKDGDSLELTLATAPSPGVSYQVSTSFEVPMKDPIEVVPADTTLDLVQTSWDFLQIGNWRFAHVCESCTNSHFSISSDNKKTSQIFRDTGTTHRGPRSDYNGWDMEDQTGTTFSSNGIVFGNQCVQVRDWRIKQMDDTHLSVSHESGNVARIYRSDGTVHRNVKSFSGYKEELGEPACTYLTDTYLQVGDWRFGAYDATHLSVSHRGGKTAMIYRSDGTIHGGPRTDYNVWNLPDGQVIMGSSDGCNSGLFE